MANPSCSKCGAEMRLIIPLPLPQLNDVIRQTKRHWAAYAKMKHDTTAAIGLLSRSQRMGSTQGPYTVTCTWHPMDRRADSDNVSHAVKYILDGLVMAGAVEGDNYRLVKAIHHEFAEPDKRNPRVEVAIVEVKA